MHLVFITIGSRGDVQPLIPIARALDAAGYRVTIATDPEFEEFVTSRGVAFRPYGPPQRPIMCSDKGRAWLESNGGLREHMQLAREVFSDFIHALPGSAEEALADADAVFFTGVDAFPTFVAEKRGIPAIALPFFPIVATGTFAPMGMPEPPFFRGLLNHLGWRFVQNVFCWVFRDATVAARRSLGLPPLRRVNLNGYWQEQGIPFLHLISPTVMPRPKDWPDNAELTGYAYLDEAQHWQPESGLVDFIAGGETPISIGFGSMLSTDPSELSRILSQALARTGKRAVVLGGRSDGELSIASDDVYVTDQAPHDWLFPKMSAVVHHGGAGTTAASLRAGKPTVVCSFFADQPFWGQRVADLGAGPAPLARKTLTVDGLVAAIEQACSDTTMQRKAAALGERLRAEDGVGATVTSIEHHLKAAVA